MSQRQETEDRRQVRRKKRIRSQIFSFIAVFIVLGALLAGVTYGGFKLFVMLKTYQEETEQAIMEQQQKAEEEKHEIVIETPEEYIGENPVEEEPVEEEAIEEVEEVDVLEEMVDSFVNSMTIEQKVAGLFIVTPEALTGVDTVIKAGDATKEALGKYPVGGLIYFGKNIKDRNQITEMISATKEMTDDTFPLFLAVDEEGGLVARVADKLDVAQVGDMAAIGESGDETKAYEAGVAIGGYLSEIGFNLDFAPDADVLESSENVTIGKRSFGTNPELVSKMAAQTAQGIEEQGVSACLKHFPGLGYTTEDTHDGLSVTERSLDEMRDCEFVGFKKGIEDGVDFVMVSHVSAPNATGETNTPCSLSKVMITDELRGELGYTGIIITDAMNMGAITDYYSADQAAIMALKAGADMILMPENFEKAYEGVLAAVADGTISEERINEALKRIYRIKFAQKAEAMQ